MEQCCNITIAFGNKEEIDKTISVLLDQKLAASCQVIESYSYWSWQKIRENSKEYLLLLKTKKKLCKEIYNVIKSIHSYDCFEFTITDITSCNPDYLAWILKETK